MLEKEARKVHLSRFFWGQISHSELIGIVNWSFNFQILVSFFSILTQYSHEDSVLDLVITVIITQVDVLQLVCCQWDDLFLGSVQNVTSVAVWVKFRYEGSRVVTRRETFVVNNALSEANIVSNSLNYILVKCFVKQI